MYFGLPNIKNDHGIESLISTLVNVAPLSKIFIIRHRNSDIPYININQYNDHMLDISIGNIGESTGVFFLHPFDDYIVKSIFNTLQGIRA